MIILPRNITVNKNKKTQNRLEASFPTAHAQLNQHQPLVARASKFKQTRSLLRLVVRVHIRHFLQRQSWGSGVHDARVGFQAEKPRNRCPKLLTFKVKINCNPLSYNIDFVRHFCWDKLCE